MASFYSALEKLCAFYKTTPSALAIKAGLSRSVVAYWRNTPNATIKAETIKKLASALSVDYTTFVNMVLSSADYGDVLSREALDFAKDADFQEQLDNEFLEILLTAMKDKLSQLLPRDQEIVVETVMRLSDSILRGPEYAKRGEGSAIHPEETNQSGD